MYKIGEVAKLVGLGSETVRYYEKEGIVPKAERAQNGYRLYDETHVRRLRFVKRSRELGFSLDKVRSLLEIADSTNMTCKSVKKVAEGHLAEVQKNIRDLQKMEKALSGMVQPCAGDGTKDCPILDILFSG